MNHLQTINSWVALITPFNDDGSVDCQTLHRLCQFHIDSGTKGIVVCGTTGEGALLSLNEFELAVQTVVNGCKDKICVFAGAGSNNPNEAVEMTKIAERCGVNGTLHAFGYYLKPNQQAIIEQFKYIHQHSQKDIMIYDIPHRNGVSIDDLTFKKITQLPRVVATKDSTSDLARSFQCQNLINDAHFAYYSGDDFSSLGFRAQGGHGCVSVTANVFPKLINIMHQRFNHQDIQGAMEIQKRLMPFYGLMFAQPNPSGIKYAVSLKGFGSPHVRAPFLEIDQALKDEIKNMFEELLVFEKSL